ncbi:hypothetical protein [Streptomyces sp. NRRL F-2799]|uniref:hypothetical protein n=1 Tax=Streptomyces sp. NRRL F-2799 TaxID=1463844 RepID=UPI0004C72BF5|nr:hypothetical protein [Streptomyces sp. NRRL F-2799]
MKKIKRLASTFAAAAALAVSALAAPPTASAADGPHAEVGTHCTRWEEVSGAGGYTFTDFRTCVVVADREGRNAFVIETDRNTYWWGGAWYNTTPGYSARVSATVNMAASPYQGGPSVTASGSWEQTSRSGRQSLGANDLIKCGARHLDVSYYQVGAYHGSDRAIDVKRSYDDFVIPCSWN